MLHLQHNNMKLESDNIYIFNQLNSPWTPFIWLLHLQDWVTVSSRDMLDFYEVRNSSRK